jgi:hypothetical protein
MWAIQIVTSYSVHQTFNFDVKGFNYVMDYVMSGRFPF